ncbi:hypothetical protein BGZ94_000155 [Podila epigama]|nr:hypothetical protein BGZ94_000155 [Podila epigama]
MTSTVQIIPELSTPEEHVSYALKNIVLPCKSRSISFIAHKYGTHALMHALGSQFAAFKDRVSGIAAIDCSHSIDSNPDPEFRKWWSLNAAGYIPSEPEEIGKVVYRPTFGMNNYLLGTKEFDHVLVDALPVVFKFLDSRQGRDNTFDHYKETTPEYKEDDPTTIIIPVHDEEQTQDDEYPTDASAHDSW